MIFGELGISGTFPGKGKKLYIILYAGNTGFTTKNIIYWRNWNRDSSPFKELKV
jgi:hypothetical protein